MTNFLIIANGPFLSQEIIKEVAIRKKIIVLDGAANKLIDYQITPDVILGDFDSIDNITKKYWGIKQATDPSDNISTYTGRNGVIIIHAKDQNTTDLVKAIRYCDNKKAKNIEIICATGGREDHHEAMKVALKTEYKASRMIIAHTCYQSLRFAVNETLYLHGEPGDYCGIIVSDPGKCISKGLEYELDGHQISTSNRLIGRSAEIKVEGSAMVILPPQLVSQRLWSLA